MTNNTLFCGLALVALGVYAFVNGTPNPETGAKPMTALIPAYVGGLLLLCAALVIWKEKLRKHVMHAAAMVGLIGFIGGFAPAVRGGFDLEKASVHTGLIMSAICAVFVFLCVQSFIAARKAREKATA